MGLIRININEYAIGSIALKNNGKLVILRKNRLFKRMRDPLSKKYNGEWKDIKSRDIFNIYHISSNFTAINFEPVSNINGNIRYINRFRERKIAKEINKCNYMNNDINSFVEDDEVSTSKAYQYIKKLR